MNEDLDDEQADFGFNMNKFGKAQKMGLAEALKAPVGFGQLALGGLAATI